MVESRSNDLAGLILYLLNTWIVEKREFPMTKLKSYFRDMIMIIKIKKKLSILGKKKD